jgi:hypothetical protein
LFKERGAAISTRLPLAEGRHAGGFHDGTFYRGSAGGRHKLCPPPPWQGTWQGTSRGWRALVVGPGTGGGLVGA